MKLSHKLVMVSAAALMSVAPLLGTAENVNTVQAAPKKTTSKTNRVIGTVNADQIKKSKSSEMRSAVNKSASLPVTGESSNSLKEIGLVMSSAVLGLLGLLGFTSEKKH